MATKTQKPKPFTVYLPHTLNKWLRDLAKQEKRSLTRQTQILIERGRAALEKQRS